MWPFKQKPYEKVVTHRDWCEYDGEPAFKIPPKEHKQGKRPFVTLEGPKIVYTKVLIDGTVMVYRGLPIWQGTLFDVKIWISK